MEDKKNNIKSLLITFINKNDLDFSIGYRNSESTVLSGYSLFLGYTEPDEILKIMKEIPRIKCNIDNEVENEFEKVFTYAKHNNYANFWKTAQAKEQYSF
jgi:hypothetical protein